MNTKKRDYSYTEVKDMLNDDNTICLNKSVKSKWEEIKASEKRIKERKRNKYTWEFIWFIQNAIIAVILILLMVFIWNAWITKTNAYESNNTVKTTIKRNNRTYSVQVWRDRVATMRSLWYSATRILDLLAIMNMECGSYKGNCFNWNDIWPMQINKIHKEQYNKSWKYYNNKDWWKLFTYQVKYANRLLDSYEANNCKPEYVAKYGVGDTYNQKRWRCVWFHYNGHPKYKYAYNKLGWERRETISNLIFWKG